LTIEPASSQTWTMLGEVYARMLPSRGPADSASEQAFSRARELDADFSPALLHLERLAFRRGDSATVRRLSAEIKAADANSSHAFERELMTACLEHRLSAADWSEAVRRDFRSVFEAGKIFSAGAKQPICARAHCRRCCVLILPSSHETSGGRRCSFWTESTTRLRIRQTPQRSVRA
jgi:hypothetical protein